MRCLMNRECEAGTRCVLELDSRSILDPRFQE
jgi:hypothetical protein